MRNHIYEKREKWVQHNTESYLWGGKRVTIRKSAEKISRFAIDVHSKMDVFWLIIRELIFPAET